MKQRSWLHAITMVMARAFVIRRALS